MWLIVVAVQVKKHISWKMVYQLTVGVTTSTPYLNLVPTLKYEYLFLNSFSKMRVDFDAKVSLVMHFGVYIACR